MVDTLLLSFIIWLTIFFMLVLFTSLLGISIALGIGLISWSFYVCDSWALILRILAGISFSFAVFFLLPHALRRARQEEREKALQKQHVTIIGLPPSPKPDLLHRIISWFRGE